MNGAQLHEACRQRQVAQVKAWLEAGMVSAAAVNWRNGQGDTALMVVAENGDAECIAMLLAHNASADAQNSTGNTALIWSAENGHVDCVKQLLGKGASPDLHNANGETALLFAAHNGHAGCVRALLASNASVDVQDKEGLTPLMLAAQEGHSDCVQLLLSSDANIQLKDKKGNTAADLARTANMKQYIHAFTPLRPVAETVELQECIEEEQQREVQDLECVVCHELRWNLRQCDGEGHSVCGDCCDALQDCPSRCGGTSFYPDKRGGRQLRSMASVCKWRCGWRGTLKDAEAHVAQCECRVVSCSACGERTNGAEWAAHKAEQCHRRHVCCQHCGGYLEARQLEGHTAEQHVLCALPGCSFRGTADNVKQHVKDAGAEHILCMARELELHKERLRQQEKKHRMETQLNAKLLRQQHQQFKKDIRTLSKVLLHVLPENTSLPRELLATLQKGASNKRLVPASTSASITGRRKKIKK